MHRLQLDCVLHFIVSLAIGFIMVSSQSLWIDEGETWGFARQRSFDDWLHTLLSSNKSEAHTPLGMFGLWAGGRIFGEGEWQLRILNAVWVAGAGVAIGRLGRLVGSRELLPLFLAHPFLWYYANEARVYALLICISAWLLLLWTMVHESGALTTSRLWALGMLATIGLACSLLFGFALIGFGLALGGTMLARKIPFERRHFVPMAATALLMVPMMAYYVWTVTRGASAAKIWNVGFSNVAFAIYELLGFGGLGPPRDTLRELARMGGLSTLLTQGHYLIGVGLLAAAYLALLLPFWKCRRDSLTMIAGGAATLSGVALFAASIMAGFPFWGRHLAYLLPLIVLLIAKTASQIPKGAYTNPLLFLICVCLLVSSLRQRFLPQYQKDDYRSATTMAKTAVREGKTIWWAADPVLAEYYHLANSTNGSGRVILFNNAMRDAQGKPAPDLIFLSKPDIHDPDGVVMSCIKSNDFQPIAEFSAFRVYARKADGQN